MDKAIEIGGKLEAAKAKLKHGQWLPFVKHIGISDQTARNYLRVWDNRKTLKSQNVLNLTDAYAATLPARKDKTLLDGQPVTTKLPALIADAEAILVILERINHDEQNEGKFSDPIFDWPGFHERQERSCSLLKTVGRILDHDSDVFDTLPDLTEQDLPEMVKLVKLVSEIEIKMAAMHIRTERRLGEILNCIEATLRTEFKNAFIANPSAVIDLLERRIAELEAQESK